MSKEFEDEVIAMGGVLHRCEDFAHIDYYGTIVPARNGRTIKWEETLFSPAGLGLIFGNLRKAA